MNEKAKIEIGTILISQPVKGMSVCQGAKGLVTFEARPKSAIPLEVIPAGEIIGVVVRTSGTVMASRYGQAQKIWVERDGKEIEVHPNHYDHYQVGNQEPKSREEIIEEMRRQEEIADQRKQDLEDQLAELDLLKDEQEAKEDAELDVVISS